MRLDYFHLIIPMHITQKMKKKNKLINIYRTVKYIIHFLNEILVRVILCNE